MGRAAVLLATARACLAVMTSALPPANSSVSTPAGPAPQQVYDHLLLHPNVTVLSLESPRVLLFRQLITPEEAQHLIALASVTTQAGAGGGGPAGVGGARGRWCTYAIATRLCCRCSPAEPPLVVKACCPPGRLCSQGVRRLLSPPPAAGGPAGFTRSQVVDDDLPEIDGRTSFGAWLNGPKRDATVPCCWLAALHCVYITESGSASSRGGAAGGSARLASTVLPIVGGHGHSRTPACTLARYWRSRAVSTRCWGCPRSLASRCTSCGTRASSSTWRTMTRATPTGRSRSCRPAGKGHAPGWPPSCLLLSLPLLRGSAAAGAAAWDCLPGTACFAAPGPG